MIRTAGNVVDRISIGSIGAFVVIAALFVVSLFLSAPTYVQNMRFNSWACGCCLSWDTSAVVLSLPPVILPYAFPVDSFRNSFSLT